MVKRLNIILKKSFRPNVEVVTDEKLPNRLTGPYRRQIHCPRLRKHKEYLKIFLQTTKKILGGILVNIWEGDGKNEVMNVKIQFQKYFIPILDSNFVSLFGCLQNSGVFKGRLGIANLCLSAENLVTSHWPSAGNGCN